MAAAFQDTLGGSFARLRTEAAEAISALSALAGESLTTLAHVDRLRQFAAELQTPLTLAIAGDRKSGKSTLINAFSGRELCGICPARDCATAIVFKYGETPEDAELAPGLIERRLPEDFLRHFTLIDASATDASVGLPGKSADLLIFVLSIADPWTERVWRQIENLPKTDLEKTIIVLQQKDLREERELQAICGHLRQMVSRRTGRAVPVFPVSGKEAWLARTAGLDKTRLWTDSRFGALENHLNDRIAASDGAGGGLRRICREAQSILAEIAAQARAAERLAAADRALLIRMRLSADQFRQQAEAQAPAFRREIDEAAARGQEQGEHLLAQRLRGRSALRLALWHNANWQREFHRNIISMMRAAAVKQIEGALRILENELNSAWEAFDAVQGSLSPESQRRLVLDAAVFEGSCAHLVEEIELTVVERMADDGTETQLRMVFAQVTRAVRVALLMAFIAGAGAVAAALLGQAIAAGAAGLTALAAVWAGGWLLARRRGAALGFYRERMSARREELARAAIGPIRAAIDDFHLKLNGLLLPIEDHCRAQEARFQPILDQVERLEDAFGALAAKM